MWEFFPSRKKIVANFFFVGFGLLTCLAKYLNLKENSPLVFSYYLFSLFLGVLFQFEMHSFCENLGSLCICQLASIKYTQALTDYRVFRWHSSKKISGISHFGNCRTAPPPAGGRRVGNLHSGEKDFLNFRFILETAGPGGQVTKWSGGPGGPGGPGGQVSRLSRCAFKRKSHFCWMASMASPPFGKL